MSFKIVRVCLANCFYVCCIEACCVFFIARSAEPVAFIVDGDRVEVHRDSVTEAPAALRLRAKRGDADVDVL